MRNLVLLSLTLLTTCTLSCSTTGGRTLTTPSPSGVIPLPAPTGMTADSFAGADPFLKDRKIVLLGEGMHMTREFPLVRIALARRLFEQHQFDMILVEGSAIDAWLASDRLLRTKTPTEEEIARIRDLAFPPIWRSPEYNLLFSKPFYIASYDFQPGLGVLKAEAVSEFLKTLKTYAPAQKRFSVWMKTLGQLSDRQSGFPNQPLDWKKREELLKVIAEYELWLPAAVLAVERQHPKTPHAAMLRLTPDFLRAQVELWNAHQYDSERKTFKIFQETRDRLGAAMIQRISREVSKTGKVAVWAHHVHVFHNTQGLARHSLGSDLKRWNKDLVYTVGTFADAGEIYALGDSDDVNEGPLRPTNEYGLEPRLKALAPETEFFVDFKTLGENSEHLRWLNEPTTARQENIGMTRLIPSRDFDAAVFIREVSKPELPWSKK